MISACFCGVSLRTMIWWRFRRGLASASAALAESGVQDPPAAWICWADQAFWGEPKRNGSVCREETPQPIPGRNEQSPNAINRKRMAGSRLGSFRVIGVTAGVMDCLYFRLRGWEGLVV